MARTIKIFDTTLRDGEQTPGVNLNLQEKLEIAKQLVRLGVDVIEGGFAIASPGDFESIMTLSRNLKGVTIASLCRSVEKDIDRAWEAVQYAESPRIHTFIATSDIHMKYKLKMTEEEVLERAVSMVKRAKGYCSNVEFSAEDASRTREEFLYRVVEAVIKAGATTVNIPDTVGYSTPLEFGRLIRNIRNNVPNIDKADISVHCHNDLGLAVANSLAAVENGAVQVECTINGLGERAGNAALEEIIMGINTRKDYYDITHRIDTTQIYRASRLVSSLTGVNVQPNKAIVGANAFAHESGIHQHGVLSEKTTYEIMTPESVGMGTNRMVLGKLSGRHAFEDRLKEMGYSLSDEEVKTAFAKFKDLADKKKVVTDKDIEALVDENIAVPEIFVIDSFQINSGNKMISTSTVSVRKDEEIITEAATGDGPVDAAFNAVERATGVNAELVHYRIKAVTEGKDALGEVTVKISNNNSIFMGKGVSTDIIEASVKAYLNAINRSISEIGESIISQ
ncbi:2-isopropylmalate synthase [Ruminiclostridium cellulolyticum]|uniref:2-isopropylmalate synthase n=1 Tax=Ruminiclostridium cellulolyticum (strain ATCC 35319 / DSM 5812 / JCM 6584 / H10) TaxID=394503 RepID=LEU1_RUMCH|nr:2-isopropylmalate synthase [Ruminiclostridium cellulolyticum]B8I1T7.1 RecName: Full=2-isopropylmalate synthase; AltName: Full=Alpha-IPM synthase; AltName: Full=Alpha-isopropylmalate synthase [Ruminiclostridium cellulolyticum H10]ACL77722.1 2-isopropylmalate synthase [Ruminiclostridium cellulolyticum H10]